MGILGRTAAWITGNHPPHRAHWQHDSMYDLNNFTTSHSGSFTTTNRYDTLRNNDATSISSFPTSRTPTPTSTRSHANAAEGPSATRPRLSTLLRQTAKEHTQLARQYEAEHRDDQARIRQLESQNAKLEKQLHAQVKAVTLRNDLARAQAELATMRRRYESASDETATLRSACRELKAEHTKLAEAYDQLDTKHARVEKSLAEAKTFIDLDDVGDVNRVVVGLKDINEAIDQIAFGFFEQFPEVVSAMPIPTDLETLAAQRAARGQLGAELFLATFHSSSPDDQPTKLDDVLHTLLKIIFCEELNTEVFRPFHLFVRGFIGNGFDLLQEMQQQMRKTGNRAQAAQWRSMSFGAVDLLVTAEERLQLLHQLSSYLINTLGNVWSQAGGPLLDNSTFLQPTAQQILRLVTESAEWLKLHRQQYLSTEFDLIFPGTSTTTTILPFDETTMKQVGGDEAIAEQKGSQVVATLAFGLAQIKLGKGVRGEGVAEKSTLVQAEVWTASDGGRVGTAETAEERCPTPAASSVG